MIDIIKDRISSSIQTKQKLLSDITILQGIEIASKMLISQLRAGHSVYFAGNGGSAADAQHLAAELSGRFYLDRSALSAEALHCNTSFLTAVANDYSYDEIYSRLISGVGRKGDVLVGLSTSGNSENIVKAFNRAKDIGIHTIALTGKSGGKMKSISDVSICVPSDDTPRIQESHILIGHIICEITEKEIFA